MFYGAKGPLLIERIGHLLSINYGSKEERKKWAIQGTGYLQEVQCTDTPYLETIIKESGIRIVSQLDNSLGSKPHFSLLGGFDENIARDIISHNFHNAIFQMESKEVPLSKQYQHLEKITQVSLLSRNFKGIEEIEYNLRSIIKSLRNYDISKPTRCEKDSMIRDRNNYEISQEDLFSLIRIQLILCISYFLQERYFDCCTRFFSIINSEPLALKVLSEYVDGMDFISKEEFIMMVNISVLISIPLDNYDDFIYLSDLKQFFQMTPVLINCLELLINTNFNKFFKIWHGEISRTCMESLFLEPSWSSSAAIIMRCKIYFFYLRISKKLRFTYLSSTLGIDLKDIKEELTKLILSGQLNFEIDDDVIHFEDNSILQNIIKEISKNGSIINQAIGKLKNQNMDLKDIIKSNPIQCGGINDTNDINNGSSEDMDIDELNDRSDISDSEGGLFES
ncbi:Pci8p SKDI_09G0940 [Saccharomyces kudriavzevii IFO 1802]|uniref:Uncharacterized protein n=2 Tax=Saccharomyces kudriavzevii (strain ATCC MYA-4449 / AS 2.2408 / CBS 8840 / NBRC 1802 / NCYC 2889) TaxID=226230 RepID=A0AA35JM01_SACK1|nr:uncharacterized protein SKDI_09G0940 [Saccharomyces kudriavzevii IFO 1802]EJT42207.1 PCI8-like protein [Saccharomyces kudriavzevii IFO 1802]CAI4064630.1 hypothetical protein SKDI_09G0940 [Saccharomyces kudriavzevii IFO 1802]